MSFFGWLVLGATVGGLTRGRIARAVNGVAIFVLLGMVGAFWGGLLGCGLVGCDLRDFALPTMAPAAIGAGLAVGLYYLTSRRRF